jgi:Domain of unknown function DUF1828
MAAFPSPGTWSKIAEGMVGNCVEIFPRRIRRKWQPPVNIAEILCKTFCDGIAIEEIQGGFSVATGLEDLAGDRVSFYVMRDSNTGLYRLEDDGALVPTLVAMGANVTEGQRRRLFDTILTQAGVEYDDNLGELRTAPIEESDIPRAAIRFMSMLDRVAALSAMRPELVMSTFREDAVRRIKRELDQRVPITEQEPVSPALSEFQPDLILRAPDRAPVAVFVAVSDARLNEAIFLRFVADYEAKEPCSVVALIEREGTRLISGRVRQRAQNRLDAVPVYYGEESAAIARIAREAALN